MPVSLSGGWPQAVCTTNGCELTCPRCSTWWAGDKSPRPPTRRQREVHLPRPCCSAARAAVRGVRFGGLKKKDTCHMLQVSSPAAARRLGNYCRQGRCAFQATGLGTAGLAIGAAAALLRSAAPRRHWRPGVAGAVGFAVHRHKMIPISAARESRVTLLGRAL